ncbi:MAG: bifunctional adenosylcobinamide kinase/adenosylcobinamide-phosphate guanylyltransferase [Bryobacterales bacterium]|nr:bifunctional adenosylcobinamide kinase/adenosylcobinamide-phosphate guanylyltransferase [Bryobacterales bacterium]
MILVGGGSRSGKTRFALDLAAGKGSRLLYIATAELLDDEMCSRAQMHRLERGPRFETVEAPRDLAGAITQHAGKFDAAVVDCLTLWVSNLILAGVEDLRPAGEAVVAACVERPVILVTNEVGCGIVPENALARRFRDEAGWMNQRMAQAADAVYWMAFGCPLKVKG